MAPPEESAGVVEARAKVLKAIGEVTWVQRNVAIEVSDGAEPSKELLDRLAAAKARLAVARQQLQAAIDHDAKVAMVTEGGATDFEPPGRVPDLPPVET